MTEMYASGYEPPGWRPKRGQVFIEPFSPCDPWLTRGDRNARVVRAWSGQVAACFHRLLITNEGYTQYPWIDSYGLFGPNSNSFVVWTARYSAAMGNPLPGFGLSWTSHGADPGPAVPRQSAASNLARQP